MRLSILCDIHWESRVDMILNELPDYRERFESRDYGHGLNRISVILMCRDPELNFKRRISLRTERGAFREEKVLRMDIMLDLAIMRAFDRTDRGSRRKIIAQRLYDEVPEVISRYKFADFERENFIADFRSWIDELGWR